LFDLNKLADELKGFTELCFARMNMDKNKVEDIEVKSDGPLILLYKKADNGAEPVEFEYKEDSLNA